MISIRRYSGTRSVSRFPPFSLWGRKLVAKGQMAERRVAGLQHGGTAGKDPDPRDVWIIEVGRRRLQVLTSSSLCTAGLRGAEECASEAVG